VAAELVLSPEARRLARETGAEPSTRATGATTARLPDDARERPAAAGETPPAIREGTEASPESTDSAKANAANPGARDLDQAELQVLADMQRRDQEVRAHEQAHKAAGGAYAGAISLSFERGPDGKNYAVGGSVSIDVSPVPNDPDATIQKMRQVQAAALAPASPSAPDRRIAAIAARTIALATAELTQQKSEAQSGVGAELGASGSSTHVVA